MHCNGGEWCTFGPEQLNDPECGQYRTGNVVRVAYNCIRGEWKYLLSLLKYFVRCVSMLSVLLVPVIHSNYRPISYRFQDKRWFLSKIAHFPTPSI